MPLQLEIISPEKLVLSRQVEMAVLPGAEGDIAAMPGHAPLMLLLRGGVVTLYEDGHISEKFFLTSGFADMTPERCVVLADDARPVAEVDHAAAAAQLAALEQQWSQLSADSVDEQERVLRLRQSAQAAIDCVEAESHRAS